MKKQADKVECRTPTPGKAPTRIDRWKYEAVRDAMLKVVPRAGEGVEFGVLPDLIEDVLSADELAKLGSIMWYTTTVKLELEVAGEIERVAGSKPQRLRRVK